MLDFHKLTNEDISKVKNGLKKYHSLSSDCTTGMIFMWNDFFDTYISFVGEEPIFMQYFNEKTYFSFPQSNNYKEVCSLINEYCEKENISVRYLNVIESDFSKIKEVYGDDTEIKECENWADYIYDSETIKELKGKKFNTQRNHINKFSRSYPDYKIEKISDENINKCIKFLKENENKKDSVYAETEYNSALWIMENYNKFDYTGIILTWGEKIAGFTCGEIIGNCLTINLEKADKNFDGVYPALANFFLKEVLTNDIKYVNREDDAGDEGLRKSKESLHPLLMLRKYDVTIK